ncbi:hypothetical protein HMPREF0649_01829 [Segatella buccae D17]|nr:hypothetical protein HMPREF0649_01829 [Segatella buccae D17]
MQSAGAQENEKGPVYGRLLPHSILRQTRLNIYDSPLPQQGSRSFISAADHSYARAGKEEDT